MNDLKIFNNKEFGGIRAFEKDGQAWFVGKDVAEVLGYTNSRKALKDHVDSDDVTNRYPIVDSLGRKQEISIINESGLYALIFGSKLPKAKAFKHWVTSEVLPSIRKTGGYAAGNETDFIIKSVTAAIMAQLPAIVSETVKTTLNYVLNDIESLDNIRPTKFELLDLKNQPQDLETDANLEESDFWESLLIEWRRFRTFIKYKSEADKAFLALCRDKYPNLQIGLRTLYRKWKAYEKSGRDGLVDRRGKHGNHRRKVTEVVVRIEE